MEEFVHAWTSFMSNMASLLASASIEYILDLFVEGGELPGHHASPLKNQAIAPETMIPDTLGQRLGCW
jgi:hypothetical protein